MRNLMTYRGLNLFLVVMAVAAMAFALLFLQRYMGFAPCPLCVFQRVGLMVMGVFALLSVLIHPKRSAMRLLLWLGSLLGILWSTFVAARHVWIQHLPPDQVPSCGPGLDYWLEALPMKEVVHQVLSGSGECAVVAWRFLGLSIPEQALILFVFLTLVHGVILLTILRK